ncbi:MAG: peptidoglycan DD-metalloendopeptidase family protein [Bacteroidales bacterium]|nr:peptidoglycan DD-metalloendopeptidase family protein [Bacteroidales bacterium]
MNSKHIIPVLLAVAAVLSGCAGGAGKKASGSASGAALGLVDSLGLAADGHIYEHGIPVDMYSVEDGEIAQGDYFSVIMERLGVPQTKTNELLEAGRKVFDVKNLRVGNQYHAYYSTDTTGEESLAYLVYDRDRRSVVVFSLEGEPQVYIDEKDVTTVLHYDEVEIQNSLWYDTQKAGCSPLLAIKLSDIYAWTIDFFGLQKGDSYKAVYETQECDGQIMDLGNIYYASFIHAGKEYQAYYFDDGNAGGNKYWNEKGEGSRKAFLKAPLKYSRISSGFSYARRHPVTRKVQPHTGVDYAAPTGTPVVSVGDGVVTKVGYAGAGGNTVHIQHTKNYRTAYLHLSRYGKGIRPGVRVSQGQVIGYVGATGRCTGPHLDFRIWENNKPVNPLKMVSPPAEPIAKDKMPAFEAAKQHAFAMRDSLQVVSYYKQAVLDKLEAKEM